jgi:tetratricopeptide (TPR) repeat protein
VLKGFPLPRLPLVLTVLGRLDEAESLAQQALTLTRSTQDWSYLSVALSHLACLSVLRGHFEDVEPYTQDTLQMVSRSRYPWGGLRAAFALACSHAQRGDADTAQSVLDRLILSNRIFSSPWPIAQLFVRVFRQLLRVQSGAAPDEVLPSLAAEFNQQASPDTYSLGPYCALVELGNLAGQPDITVQPSRHLALALERGALFSHGWVCLIPRILGIAATLQQDWLQAEQQFHTAIAVAMRTGARPELGRTYLDYARMRAARAQAGDHLHAIGLARQAEHLLQTLGMVSWAQDAQRVRQGLQAIPYSRYAPHMIQTLATLARQKTRFLE